MSELILVRHGQSTWNAANRFTGWVDVPLSRRGRREAMLAAEKLRGRRVDVCFSSLLVRAIETAVICLTECEELAGGKSPIVKHQADDPDWHGWDQYEGDPAEELPIITCQALDERYYGELQGLNKRATAERYGEEQVRLWRRSYSEPPPGGESLADTAERTLPFFRDRILCHLRQGDNVLVSAHGNSLRSIIMELDDLSPQAVTELELATGVPIVYAFDATGRAGPRRVLE